MLINATNSLKIDTKWKFDGQHCKLQNKISIILISQKANSSPRLVSPRQTY